MSEPIIENGTLKNHCGHEVPKGVKFCPECGAQVTSLSPLEAIQQRVDKLEQLVQHWQNKSGFLEDPPGKRIIRASDDIQVTEIMGHVGDEITKSNKLMKVQLRLNENLGELLIKELKINLDFYERTQTRSPWTIKDKFTSTYEVRAYVDGNLEQIMAIEGGVYQNGDPLMVIKIEEDE